MKLWAVMAKRISVSWLNYLHLVLFLMPPPHGREQGVQEPHGPTSQSTEIRFKFKTSVILFNSLTIPGGLQATLQESVSASSIILELSFAHFSPLCLASAMISLRKKNNKNSCVLDTILSLSDFFFPIHIWQSKMSTTPMVRHHSQPEQLKQAHKARYMR